MSKHHKPVYRVQDINGRFDYVATKVAAVARAIELAGADLGTPEAHLVKHWGITITRVSAEVARSVGL